jgi:aspartate kinase
LASGKIPVTQGFIGVTEDGAPTTMGRESSDFTASILGAALQADLVQIWTDVDGILTADPSVVRDIRKIPALTFTEAFELSYFGAKVLHPNTMLPLLEGDIPVEVRNSLAREEGGTRIERRPGNSDTARGVKSISFQKGMTLIAVRPRKRNDQYLFWDAVLSVLARQGLRSRVTAASEYCLSLAVVERVDPAALGNALDEFGMVEVHPNKATLTLVGEGVGRLKGLSARVFTVLSDLQVDLISFGASNVSLSLVLDESVIEQALHRLHQEFFPAGKEGGGA